MQDYTPPVREQRFVLEHICDVGELCQIERFADATSDVIDAILEESARLTHEVIAPTNRHGDTDGSKLENGVVRVPDSFGRAYSAYCEGGWNSLSFDTTYGGQALPFVLATAVHEGVTSGNMALSLLPTLNQGAIEAIAAHGSDEQKARYLPNMIDGRWTGTMNLTEPQAGSDVGAVRTKATPVGDGSYRIKGQKIYITWGEHELAENLIHLVLARLPDAPEGTRGISMFIVPKYHVKLDGSLGPRNDVRCVSLEHKLGIHASPTCVMSYGDNDECIGYLCGEENKGMRNMFTMMNHARLNVGLQGVAVAERAYQQAVAYARERVQSAESGKAGAPVTIIHHPDVRRMLMTMRSFTEACRAICYLNAAAIDRGHHHPDGTSRAHWQGLADLLTPISKGFSTDIGVEVASLAVQVHGGMGFVEETGVAQHYRDARIAPIYEGTNGIQAMDLVGRKLNMAGGEHWRRFYAYIRDFTNDLPDSGPLAAIKPYLEDGIDALQNAAVWLAGNDDNDHRDAGAGAQPFLRMSGIVVGGFLLARQAEAAQKMIDAGEGDPAWLKAKIATARFFAEQIMPQGTALLGPITRGSDILFALEEEEFAA